MGKHSIRFRLTVWYAAVLTAGLVLFSVLVWLSLRQQLLADLDQDLNGRATRLETYFRNESARAGVQLADELEEFCQALPETSYVSISGANGFEFRYPSKIRAPQIESRMLQRQFTLNDQAFYLQLGTPVDDVSYVLDRLRLLLLSLVPFVIAIACLGGVWLSRRALKPVQDVTAAAHSISIENLSDRLPVPETGDEIARLAEVLNSMLARLDSAVATLSQFAADASHELRTPLAVIRTTAELALRRGRTAESYRESLETVVAEAERMTHLVEDLLLLARSDRAVNNIPREIVDLRHTLQDVCAEMSSLAVTRNIHLRASLDGKPAEVWGLADSLHRLFVLLLDNAVKYSHAGGEIEVSLEREDGTVSVAIEDHGRGISPSDLPHIFKRFYRADKARTGGGHGLGLPLAESIAQAHGAKIEVSSSEGAGSTFRVVFPEASLKDNEPPSGVNSDSLLRT
jgi:two-component system heavy metal sensor histidine kinase CusS